MRAGYVVNESELARRALRLNLDSYRELVRVAAGYASACARFWADVADSSAVVARPRAARPATAAAAPAPALLLQGPLGSLASARFRVTNDLPRAVEAEVIVGPALDDDGKPVAMVIDAKPGRLALAPGQTGEVELATTLTDELALGRTCRARIDIPGLAEDGIDVLVRRSPAPARAPAAKPTAGKASAPKARRKGRGSS